MADTESRTVRLYTVEDQEIYRTVYKTIFPSGSTVNLLGISTNGGFASIKDAVSALNPDVLLMGTKSLNRDIIEQAKQIRADFPRVGVVLFFVTYHSDDIKLLRRLTGRTKAGMAVFLRQSLERVEQLRQIIISVSEGHVILDPALTSLLFTEKQRPSLLSGFTHRELEILNLLAQGDTNSVIAEVLCIDIKTVRHHLNNMYSKLKADADFKRKHPRVSAVRLYLETMGELSTRGAP